MAERADLRALGLILYELLVGHPPFDDAAGHGTGPSRHSAPPKPSSLIDDVDPRLERAILKALSSDPRHPASAAEFARLLDSPASAPQVPSWVAGLALALAIGAIVLVSSWFMGRTGRSLTDQDTIVLADFVNTTGDPVFDVALKVALAVSLEQSPFLKVFPDERVQETLRLMQQPPGGRLTRSTAREVARRERLKALVAESIAPLGTHYVVTIEAVNAETGDVMAREQAEASAKEQVLSSLGSAASRLRERLGESLASVQRFDVPLPQATTPSLEALEAFAHALDRGRMVPRIEAIPHLKRAIELDPDFAMAYATLSGVYANTGRSAEAPAFARRAFELRDRVSERERFFISWRYYVDAEQAWDKALDLAASWTETYPREAFAFNSLGLASAAFGQHERAIAAFREATRLDPSFVPPRGNIAGSLIALGRFDEARGLVQEAAARGVDFISVRRTAYLLAFLRDDTAGMTHELELAQRTPQSMWAEVWDARTAASAGRISTAHALFARGADAARAGGFDELAAQWSAEDAEAHAVTGSCSEALRELPAALALSRDNFTLERAARTLALCDAEPEASSLAAELRARFPTAALTTRVQLPVIAAVRALRQREFARALDALNAVEPYDHAPAAEFWPSFLRGEAKLGLGDARGAAAQFESILGRRGEAPTSPLYALARLRLARAAAAAGDTPRALAAYGAFLAGWNRADPGLRPVEEASREYAQLQ